MMGGGGSPAAANGATRQRRVLRDEQAGLVLPPASPRFDDDATAELLMVPEAYADNDRAIQQMALDMPHM